MLRLIALTSVLVIGCVLALRPFAGTGELELQQPLADTELAIEKTGLDQLPDSALRDLDRLLLEAGESPDKFSSRPSLLVFHRGIKCVQCMSQLSMLGAKQQEFEQAGVSVIGLCPEMPAQDVVEKLKSSIGVRFPLILDEQLKLFEKYNCVDPNGEVLHGLVLLDSNGKVLWDLVSEHAYAGTEKLVEICQTYSGQD